LSPTDHQSKPIMPDRVAHRRLLRGWLHIVALMVVAIILVGGATRLTDSGLSITEWKPIHGVVPPLNDTQWQEEFSSYQQIPEFRLQNFDMDLAGFKAIYWWEWGHRLLARTIGLVVFLPLVFFWVTGRIERNILPKLITILVLGGLQGAVGWWMVVSGLSVRVDVSQIRLAIHLTLAFIILTYIIWVARGLAPPVSRSPPGSLQFTAGMVVGLALVQIFLGGLVAGLDAGLTFNTWPLMDGGLVPGAAFALSPWWQNVLNNVAMVQFQHRFMAYVLLAAVMVHALRGASSDHRAGAFLVAVLVLAQAVIGVVTLVTVVPIPLALVHQFGAVVVVIAVDHWRVMASATPFNEEQQI
jgi:cytochrome c oxidase assembly protein subunit 15